MARREVTKWMNVYRAGYYHSRGKPGTIDRHGGDLYDNPQDALANIGEPQAYIATVPVTYPEPETTWANPMNSEPVPISATRSMFHQRRTDHEHVYDNRANEPIDPH